MAQQVQYSGTGRRKDATARVRLVPGSGKITMNGKAIEDYIPFANSRALLAVDPDFRDALKKAGLLTRDPRMKERRKPGLKKARKAAQFSKR